LSRNAEDHKVQQPGGGFRRLTPRFRRPAVAVQRRVAFAATAVLLLVSSLLIVRAPPGRHGDRLARECAVVLMLLMSPASSKPHFVTVIMPALVLARDALYGRSRMAIVCLAVSFTCAIGRNRMVVGRRIGLPMLWMGGVTWCALALLLGCLVALWAPPSATRLERTHSTTPNRSRRPLSAG
jgi:hypothetical protein